MRIRDLEVPFPFLMAPMAGVTGPAFRALVKRMGAGLAPTEMVSAEGLRRNRGRTWRYLRRDPGQGPLWVQLFGSKAEAMAEAARMAVDGGADLLDVNMGCPVRKVVRTGAGGALLRDPVLAGRVVREMRRACSVPITVKLRAGWSPGQVKVKEMGRVLEGEGADALILHARVVTEGFGGKARWEWIGELKEAVGIPVIGNGDVWEAPQALAMIRECGCDGVMIGRGACRAPWIFKEIHALWEGRPQAVADLWMRREVILEHYRLLRTWEGDERASKEMKGILLRYTKGLPFSGRFRGRFCGAKDAEDLMQAVEEFFLKLEAGGGLQQEEAGG